MSSSHNSLYDYDTDYSDHYGNSNEYYSDSSDWSSDDKLQREVISKKKKKYLNFKILVRLAVIHFNTNEYIKFKHDLKQINYAIKVNKWNNQDFKMPKFYVKHMMKIHNRISTLNVSNIGIKQERNALKLLQKNGYKQIYHIKQFELFARRPEFWKDEVSDIGLSDTEHWEMSTTQKQLLTFAYIKHIQVHFIHQLIPDTIVNICFQYYCIDDFDYLWKDVTDEQDEADHSMVKYENHKVYKYGSNTFSQNELVKMHDRSFWIKNKQK